MNSRKLSADEKEAAIEEGADDGYCACGEMPTCCGDPGCCPMIPMDANA